MTLFVTMLTASTVWAADLITTSGTYGDCSWTFDTGTGLLTISGSGKMGDGFGYAPFRERPNIKSVVIEDGVTNISDECFFGSTGIETVTLPASLLTIGSATFQGCTSLTSFDLSACTNLKSTGNSTCYGCSSLTMVTLPTTLKAIGDQAFQNCTNLQTINLNDCSALERICVQAFFGCSKLEGEFSLPATLKGISTLAFKDCAKLTKLTIADGTVFTDDTDDIQDTKGYGSSTFEGCTSLTLSLPDNMMLAILAANKRTGDTGNQWRPFVGMFDKLPATITGFTLSYDGGFVKATFKDDGTPVAIPNDVNVGMLGFDRTMPVGQCATIMLPCAVSTGSFSNATFYSFTGVSYNDVSGQWEAKMTAIYGDLAANTPYLVKASAASIKRDNYGNLTLNTTTGTKQTTVGDWSFKGVYEEKTWTAGEVGKDYGFAATGGTATDGVTAVSAGDFVKIGAGAHIKPMRSYLTYTDSGNPWATSAPAMNRAPSELPGSINVVLVEADGSTTTVGTIRMERNAEGWYSLDGLHLDSKPTTKGLYIHNGRKEVVK